MKKISGAIFILALAGVGISVFLYLQHIGAYSTEICEINATFDCRTVDQSPYSEIYGVPISLLGIIGYGLLLLGALLKFFDRQGDRGLDLFLAAAATGGLAFSLYLTGVEAFILRAWCVFCLSQQVIMLVIFILAVLLYTGGRK